MKRASSNEGTRPRLSENLLVAIVAVTVVVTTTMIIVMSMTMVIVVSVSMTMLVSFDIRDTLTLVSEGWIVERPPTTPLTLTLFRGRPNQDRTGVEAQVVQQETLSESGWSGRTAGPEDHRIHRARR